MKEGQRESHTTLIYATITTLGIIWGDIGTSPLYTMAAIYGCEEECENPEFEDIRGALSCIIWSLLVIACLKYIVIVLRFDHHGEGGIFALFLNISRGAKRPMSRAWKLTLTMLAIVGSSALIADSVLTPALSVLSAIEGIRDVRYFDASQKETIQKLIVPITIAILLGLFSIQSYGTTKIGRFFGPIMIMYFSSLAGVGIYNLVAANQWGILGAFSPHYAVEFFVSGRFAGFEAYKKLSSIVLCVTGAEAVYSDVGHTGKPPIYISWTLFVFPALVLNYAGQAAFLVDNPASIATTFWSSVPTPYYIPMLVIATAATVVASQAMITGCFSLMSYATSLKLFMKIRVVNTDPSKPGQMYIPEVNLGLCICTIALVAGFQKSVALAGAYGISVVITFNITTFMLACALYFTRWYRRNWVFPIIAVTPFALIDLIFLTSNFAFKFIHGGYITLILAALITATMLCWSYGRAAKSRARIDETTQLGPLASFSQIANGIAQKNISRCPGIGIYLSPMRIDEGKRVVLSSTIVRPEVDGVDRVVSAFTNIDREASGISVMNPTELVHCPVPLSLQLFLKVTGSIQRVVVLLHVRFNKDKPALNINQRVEIDEIVSTESVGIYSVTVSFGFAEPLSEVDVKKIVRQWIIDQLPSHRQLEDLFEPTETTFDDQIWYFVHEEVHEPKEGSGIFRRALIWIYTALHSVSRSAHVFLNLPPSEVVQLGGVVKI
jgi:KUP system potassium uptake protein